MFRIILDFIIQSRKKKKKVFIIDLLGEYRTLKPATINFNAV